MGQYDLCLSLFHRETKQNGQKWIIIGEKSSGFRWWEHNRFVAFRTFSFFLSDSGQGRADWQIQPIFVLCCFYFFVKIASQQRYYIERDGSRCRNCTFLWYRHIPMMGSSLFLTGHRSAIGRPTSVTKMSRIVHLGTLPFFVHCCCCCCIPVLLCLCIFTW